MRPSPCSGYFSSEDQNSPRWLYYRKRTEGQNTLLIGDADQNVAGTPQTTFQSTGEAQDALNYTPTNSSTAFFTADLSEMYNSTTVRGAHTSRDRLCAAFSSSNAR